VYSHIDSQRTWEASFIRNYSLRHQGNSSNIRQQMYSCFQERLWSWEIWMLAKWWNKAWAILRPELQTTRVQKFGKTVPMIWNQIFGVLGASFTRPSNRNLPSKLQTWNLFTNWYVQAIFLKSDQAIPMLFGFWLSQWFKSIRNFDLDVRTFYYRVMSREIWNYYQRKQRGQIN